MEYFQKIEMLQLFMGIPTDVARNKYLYNRTRKKHYYLQMHGKSFWFYAKLRKIILRVIRNRKHLFYLNRNITLQKGLARHTL